MNQRSRGTMDDMPTFLRSSIPKRLVRPETSQAFRVTERDIAILRALARWRFMTSEQIERYLTLIYGTASAQQVRRRLLRLFAAGLVDRPRHQHVQLSSFDFLVYAIGRKGATLLAQQGESIEALQWTLKNKRATAVHIMHTLETTEAMLAFEAGCVRDAQLRLIDHEALVPLLPAETQRRDRPFRLAVKAAIENRQVPLYVIPDRVFSVALPGEQRINAALELDRGTMSIAAKRLTSKSSFARKIHAYMAAFQQRAHTAQWGFASFRVLTIAPSERRIAGMLTVQRKITQGRLPAFFLYSTFERLQTHGAFGAAWITADADHVSLLER